MCLLKSLLVSLIPSTTLLFATYSIDVTACCRLFISADQSVVVHFPFNIEYST